MIIKTIKWILLAFIALLATTVVVLTVGSELSLDHEREHSRETLALSSFSTESADGLVRIDANGYEFRARVAGFQDRADKPAVVLLHGFPVTSAMWEPLIEPLVNAGYRVLAFDQRGYSPGARPTDYESYRIDILSDDVLAVADAAGLDSFHLAGHDWGAIAGWVTVMRRPQRILSWTALSIAHPAAFGEAMQNDPDQRARSSYFLLFSMPWLPQTLFSFNGFSMLKAVYGPMSDSQREEYLRVFAEPGALSAAFNWYRAAMRGANDNDGQRNDVATPTLFIWGINDQAAGRVAVEAQEKYMQGPYRKIELDTGHWVMETHGEEITAAMLKHLAAN
jgi:pimeloyl-ACP methyl ester carboxylesterase